MDSTSKNVIAIASELDGISLFLKYSCTWGKGTVMVLVWPSTSKSNLVSMLNFILRVMAFDWHVAQENRKEFGQSFLLYRLHRAHQYFLVIPWIEGGGKFTVDARDAGNDDASGCITISGVCSTLGFYYLLSTITGCSIFLGWRLLFYMYHSQQLDQ